MQRIRDVTLIRRAQRPRGWAGCALVRAAKCMLSVSLLLFCFRAPSSFFYSAFEHDVSDPLYILYISFSFSIGLSACSWRHTTYPSLSFCLCFSFSFSCVCVYIFVPFIPIFLDSPLSSTIDANLLRLFHPMDPKVSLPVGVVILVARATRR